MSKKKEQEEIFAARLPGILQYHQTMLADGVRNKLLSEAIKAQVTKETNFLDIGAGTGIWAILAAKLGAKRVVAIEIEECLIPIIFRHAQENGVADKIEIIHANSDDVRIRGKFDVIVSELFGQDAIGGRTIQSFINLRDRFLAPAGILIPQKISMLAAPVRIETSVCNIPANVPVKCDFLKSVKLNYGWNAPAADRRQIEFLAAPEELVEVDFRNVRSAPSLENLSAAWQVENLSEANAIAVFNYSTFADGIRMNNFESQSWGTGIYEFQPFSEENGELRFELNNNDKKTLWSIALVSNEEIKKQTFSPFLGVARIRMAQQMTPHRRFKTPKIEVKKPRNEKNRSRS